MSDEATIAIDPDPAAASPLARLGPFGDLVDANLAVGRLNDEGIRASLAGEHLAATLGPLYGAAYAGGPFVLVPKADEADARRIIGEVEAARRERVGGESPPCPTCEHRPTVRVLPALRWAGLAVCLVAFLLVPLTSIGILLFVLGVPMVVWQVTPVWKCPACHRRFAAAVPTNDRDADADPG